MPHIYSRNTTLPVKDIIINLDFASNERLRNFYLEDLCAEWLMHMDEEAENKLGEILEQTEYEEEKRIVFLTFKSIEPSTDEVLSILTAFMHDNPALVDEFINNQ